MTSSRGLVALMATLHFIAFTSAGPLGPLPMQNVTSSDMGLKEGSCALGDVVYMSGDEFPGSNPCERCQCAAGGVRCAQQQCEPRPGCKALHRPDHCCPTYQCECEQQGRVYGNGEKLVDPLDPCRVCYCQGGEVVCRRIACFVRDDCKPRLVPGRCCPEYDNCPLRGVTALPPSLSTIVSASAEAGNPTVPNDDKPKFSIKEITPVSEIPVITDVKIKEILPSPSVDAAEYSSSKSPLIPREATSEKSTNTDYETLKKETEDPSTVVNSTPDIVSPEQIKETSERKDTPAPSKISLSTQYSINSEIYPSPIVPIVATLGIESNSPDSSPVVITTKAPIVEEEDPSLFDHNPAFPPLPDDLSVLSNHGDEIVPEPSADSDHVPVEHAPSPEVFVANASTPTTMDPNELLTTTVKYTPDTSVSTTERSPEVFTESSTTIMEITSTSPPTKRENPTIKLRSAIPSEVFSPSSSEEATSRPSDPKMTETKSTFDTTQTSTALPLSTTESANTVTEAPKKSAHIIKFENQDMSTETITSGETSRPSEINKSEETSKPFETTSTTHEPPYERVSFITTGKPEPEPEVTSTTQKYIFTTTHTAIEFSTTERSLSFSQEQTTNPFAKSNIATEGNFQTELSSLPIETSDQKPHETSSLENVSKNTNDISTTDPFSDRTSTTQKSVTNSEADLISKADSRAIENVETTEFVLTPFGSSETSTDAVELIKIPGDADKNAAIIDSGDGNKNALTDLIKLVSDVASMSEHTDAPLPDHRVGYSESEELVPVNVGYKSKNSNFNQNSITEVPFKSKSIPNKQKVVEIEDDEEGGITDSQASDDKAEPTTRRPLIDHVFDDKSDAKTDNKDIEIITQSYVPTINRRPTKVILDDRSGLSEELPQDDEPAAAASLELATDSAVPSDDSSETVTGSSLEVVTELTVPRNSPKVVPVSSLEVATESTASGDSSEAVTGSSLEVVTERASSRNSSEAVPVSSLKVVTESAATLNNTVAVTSSSLEVGNDAGSIKKH